jgi:hypothetical protein
MVVKVRSVLHADIPTRHFTSVNFNFDHYSIKEYLQHQHLPHHMNQHIRQFAVR